MDFGRYNFNVFVCARARANVCAMCVYIYLRIDANDLVAFIARVSKHILVTFDTIWMLIPKNITLSRQALVALPATKMTRMKVLIHGLRIFTTEN